jgi:hypothetical protein
MAVYHVGMARRRDERARAAAELRLSALTSPLRIELIGAIKEAKTCSIRELAERMGRPADGLYHHVRLLLGAGVLVEVETRKVGRRSESVYALASPRVAGKHDPDSPESRRAAAKAASAALRLAEREFAAALESGEKGCAEGAARILAKRQTAWLTDAAIAELHGLLARVEALLSEGASERRGRPYSFTTILTPLIRRSSGDERSS